MVTCKGHNTNNLQGVTRKVLLLYYTDPPTIRPSDNPYFFQNQEPVLASPAFSPTLDLIWHQIQEIYTQLLPILVNAC